MRVSPPLWLNPPEIKWISCSVDSRVQPQGYVVRLDVDGQQRSIVVSEDLVRLKGDKVPGDGRLRVVVVAELPNDDPRMLTELPATPIAGSQRIKVSPSSLQPA